MPPSRYRLAGDGEARPAERARMVRRPSRCAHSARAEGVALRVHGIEIYNKRKPQKLKNKVLRREQKKPTETVAPTLLSTAKQAPAAQRAEA